jgi:hypothetical protein
MKQKVFFKEKYNFAKEKYKNLYSKLRGVILITIRVSKGCFWGRTLKEIDL